MINIVLNQKKNLDTRKKKKTYALVCEEKKISDKKDYGASISKQNRTTDSSKSIFFKPIKRNNKQNVFSTYKKMHTYCENNKKHTGNTVPNKIALI